MLSQPDFSQKKIVTINPWDADTRSLSIQSHTIILKKDGKATNKILLHDTFAIFLIGNVTLTSNFIQECQEHGLSLFILSKTFKLQCTITSTAQGNYLLRTSQYTLSKKQKLEFCKALIANKLINQSQMLSHYNHTTESKTIHDYLQQHVQNATCTKKLLGHEGYASKLYFQTLFSEIGWHRRAPRTKEDIPNILLDMGYTYLFNYMDALLSLFGFDTYKGFYHELFYQRKSLVCDCIEPFRCVIDHALVKAYNLGRVKSSDFIENGLNYAIKPNKEIANKYQRIFLEEIQKHNQHIYDYVHGLYKSYLNHQKCPALPQFIIKFD